MREEVGKGGRRMRVEHVGFVFQEMGRLPLETGEPEEVISSQSVSGNTA